MRSWFKQVLTNASREGARVGGLGLADPDGEPGQLHRNDLPAKRGDFRGHRDDEPDRTHHGRLWPAGDRDGPDPVQQRKLASVTHVPWQEHPPDSQYGHAPRDCPIIPMRPKSLALLLLALGCGLVASIGITEVMAKRNARAGRADGRHAADLRGHDRHRPGRSVDLPGLEAGAVAEGQDPRRGPSRGSRTSKAAAPAPSSTPASRSWRTNCSAKGPASRGPRP